METRALGKDGPRVPVICFGTWPLAGGYGPVPEDRALATLQAALDVGLTFIDTAEGYRAAESIVGRAIRGRRHEVFLATKVSGIDHSLAHIDRALENSLKLLGSDYVDLYQIHQPSPEWPIAQTMERIVRHQEAGKVRYIGVSNFSPKRTEEASRHSPIHSSQPRYNLLFREFGEDVLPYCQSSGIGVIAHSALARGLLGGRYRPGHRLQPDDQRYGWEHLHGEGFKRIYGVTERLKRWAADQGRDLVQLAIAWVLANPAVTSSIVGARKPEDARHLVKAADWKLTPQDLKEIDEIQGDVLPRFPKPAWET